MEQVRPIKPKRLPGPAGTSCLTCKRRRKKCDQGRPTCQRCAEGDYNCLGYGHIQQRRAAKLGSGNNHCGSIEDVIQLPTLLDKGRYGDTGDNGKELSVSFIPQPPIPLLHEYWEEPFYDPTGYIASTETPFDTTSPVKPSLSLAAVNNPPWDLFPLSSSNSSPGPEETNTDQYQVSSRYGSNFLTGAQTVQMLSSLSPGARQSIRYVLSLYERVLDSVYFKPKDHEVTLVRNMVVTRIQASSIARCTVLLAAKMAESMLNGNSSDTRTTFRNSVHRFEAQLRTVKSKHPNPIEIRYLLSGFLEVAFLKMRVSNGYNTYLLLRNAAPTFLEIVYSDSNLWPDPNGPPMVCMSKVISSTRFELGHFVLTDVLCSMAYGVPQVVDYETTTRTRSAEIHPIEWIHCCPHEFQICIAEMNRRCATSYVAPDWHVIEHRLLSYKVPLIPMDHAESWKTIARVAVVESWRQTLLIYLYMAVCGVSSDDTRVQSAVRQTFQLFEVVKRQEPPKVNVHFMFQYLIAGACTRSEKQRALARERLLDSFDNECWILPGCEMVPVLDHLWHGAAANGQPVRWSDYIMSRQIALPIPI
ncbi:hypothetical protein RSOLAG1IB_06859 [Rhizoctonia solani AG-1 IB]|uniref:Zn(2)-C6 fungal-type domain-containing protein n=1 Tax=Thanatephorus cucumeris (strain AG1-IB / isolate 7/3/14) TaxID=1108050 RepID=A0A0B7FDA4_THACB|nr:hypothetical protein RSOLAG1IB_06859 [Rhizoctonia solani AG-1 IB]